MELNDNSKRAAKKTIKRREFKLESNDKDLAHEILEDIKASPDLGLLRCVQCGMCTSTCPASRHSDYDSREIIKRVLDNDRTLIDDDIIWNCFYCYNCHSICPVGNSVCLVNQILRQMAIEKNKGKQEIKTFISFADSFMDKGLGVIPQEYCVELSKDYGLHWDNLQDNLQDIRDELGLDEMNLFSEAEDEIDKTLEAVGFKNRVKSIKDVGECE